MTTNQLFFAMAGLFIAVFGMFYKYIDSKFDGVNSKFDGLEKRFSERFTGIDNQLKFLVDHVVDHCVKIAKLEERTKNK